MALVLRGSCHDRSILALICILLFASVFFLIFTDYVHSTVEGNVFRRVCPSVHGGGGGPPGRNLGPVTGYPPGRDLGPVAGSYPPPPPHGNDMGPVEVLWDGDGVPPGCEQMPVKTVPSRRTMYAGSNDVAYSVVEQDSLPLTLWGNTNHSPYPHPVQGHGDRIRWLMVLKRVTLPVP